MSGQETTTGAAVEYHPDPQINAEVAAEVLANERADLAIGYPPRAWICPCGVRHSRGHFFAIGTHRCLSCGYVGTGGVMVGPVSAESPSVVS